MPRLALRIATRPSVTDMSSRRRQAGRRGSWSRGIQTALLEFVLSNPNVVPPTINAANIKSVILELHVTKTKTNTAATLTFQYKPAMDPQGPPQFGLIAEAPPTSVPPPSHLRPTPSDPLPPIRLRRIHTAACRNSIPVLLDPTAEISRSPVSKTNS
jgi:hypothetical protein